MKAGVFDHPHGDIWSEITDNVRCTCVREWNSVLRYQGMEERERGREREREEEMSRENESGEAVRKSL